MLPKIKHDFGDVRSAGHRPSQSDPRDEWIAYAIALAMPPPHYNLRRLSNGRSFYCAKSGTEFFRNDSIASHQSKSERRR